MLIESIAFTAQTDLSDLRGDHLFRYCALEDVSLAEFHIVQMEGAFLNCSFTNVEMYWMLLNGTVFIDCTFVGCSFLGTTFASCRVVECTFTNCVFAKDNMGGACSFNETVWYGSTQNGCTGLSEALVPLGAAPDANPTAHKG